MKVAKRPPDPTLRHPWMRSIRAIGAARGESVIGSEYGRSGLLRLKVGKGQLIYIGWSIAAWRPSGDVTAERRGQYEEQFELLRRVVESLEL